MGAARWESRQFPWQGSGFRYSEPRLLENLLESRQGISPKLQYLPLEHDEISLVHRLISGRHTAVGDLADFQGARELRSVREERATRKIGQSAIGPPGWLERSVCVVARSLRIAADTLLTRAWHPNTFEANGMPPTYETMH